MANSFCILGNPNVGKTSLFNALTGTYEYVGNWSGVTVEKKVDVLKLMLESSLIYRVYMNYLLFQKMRLWLPTTY